MLLIAGLGNPGAKYARNRHNVGFMAVDALASAFHIAPWRKKFRGEAAEGQIGHVRVLLLKPQTFYNDAGHAVAEAANFYKLSGHDVVVFHDEIDLAPGRLRMKRGGGAAGNNGVRSITDWFGEDFRRVRIGMGHPGHKDQVMPYVLGDVPKAEEPWLAALLDAVVKAAPLLAAGEDDKFQGEVMRLAPAPKADPRRPGLPETP